MSDREKLIENRDAYRTIGDLDKPFHQPECRCSGCETWRRLKGRPTHEELDQIDAPPRTP